MAHIFLRCVSLLNNFAEFQFEVDFNLSVVAGLLADGFLIFYFLRLPKGQ